MSASTGIAELAEQKSAFADYYRWQEPNREITVCLNLETANRLQKEVFGTAGSSLDAGVEIGGILLGRRERDGDRIVTFIDDFDLVPCEHRNGPFYSLTANDLQEFQTALARRRSGANQANSVLGYYRSHKREDIYLSPDDLALIRASFTEPDNVFLLLKALPGKVCTAGFFFWDNGKIQPEFTDSEFALIPTDRAEFLPVQEGLAVELEELAAFRPEPPEEYGRSRPRGKSRWMIGGFAFAAVAGATVFAILGDHESRNGLPSERPVTVVANQASGSPQVTLPETKAEPPSRKPGPAAPIATPNTPKTQERKAPERKPEYEPRQNLPAVTALSRSRPEQPILPNPVSATREKVRSEPGSASVGTRPTETSQILPVQTAASQASQTPPPVIATPPSVIAPPPERAPDVSPVLRQPQSIPAAPVVQTPVAQTPVAQAVPKSQPVETSFAGPQIVHQVTPAIPLGIAAKITTNIQIDVTVTISEAGKVIGARVSSTSGATAGLLTLEALKAAQLFRFRPAQENNRSVRSDMVLTFRFAPKAH